MSRPCIFPAVRALSPISCRTRTAATSRPSWSAAKARSAASSARAFCRPIPASSVKFGGPFVRLPVGKLDAAKMNSATLRNIFARYADCMLAQIFQSTACNAIHSIEQRTAKWIVSAMERTDGNDVVPLTHEQLATLLGRRPFLCQPGDPDLQGRRDCGDAARLDPGAQPRRLADARLSLQRSRQNPFRGSAARGLSDGRAGRRRRGFCIDGSHLAPRLSAEARISCEGGCGRGGGAVSP